MTPLEAALSYATILKWKMLPVLNKRPVCEGGVYGATNDALELRKLWKRFPDAQPAVRCDRFFVVDIDPRNNGLDSWMDLLASKSLEISEWERKTWRALTGGNGIHWYFEHDKRLESVPLGQLLPGVDVKGNGKHYVLVPPAKTTGNYTWVNKPRNGPLYQAPEWLIAEILRRKSPRPHLRLLPPPGALPTSDNRVERARRYARYIEPAVAGESGHTHTLVTCIRICKGFSLDAEEGLEALRDWNQTCVPPWSERELKRKISEALRIGTMRAGALL